jgi:RNA polymerase sigma-70 factor (ECF subfamily)
MDPAVLAFERPLPAAGMLTARDLWDSHGRRVYKFAAMVARDDQEAQDVAQEALLRAIRGLPSFTPQGGGIEAWLWRIVANTARDFGRMARRRQLLADRLVQRRAYEPCLDAELDRWVDTDVLLAAVRRLPAVQRTLIALRFGADLEYTEVGRMMGLSAEAARSGTRRALTTLHRDLERSTS